MTIDERRQQFTAETRYDDDGYFIEWYDAQLNKAEAKLVQVEGEAFKRGAQVKIDKLEIVEHELAALKVEREQLCIKLELVANEYAEVAEQLAAHQSDLEKELRTYTEWLSLTEIIGEPNGVATVVMKYLAVREERKG